MKEIVVSAANGAGLVLIACLAVACSRSDRPEVVVSDETKDECQYKICEGDKLPPYNSAKESLLKLDGRWFIGPKSYYSAAMNGATFLWPSRRPLGGEVTGESNASDVPPTEEVIYLYLRSRAIPDGPRGYALVELAEKNHWIAGRTTLRPGLDQVLMKHELGPDDHYLDNVTYYVATDLRGPDGLPPVATCNHDDARNSGGTGFLWRDGIWAGSRMNQKLCADWPEIHEETMRVLSLLKEIEQ
jgi:hypothetical protein